MSKTLLLSLAPLALVGPLAGSLAAFPRLVALSPAGPSAIPGLPRLQDDEEEKPDKRPEIKTLLDQLKEHVSKRGKEDDQAVSVIDQLVQEYAKSGPKDQAAITDGLEKCFKAKRKDLDDGAKDNRLYLAAAVSLGEMGANGADVLSGLVNHKDFRDDIDLQRRIVLALGKTQSEKHVDVLLELLKHHDARMQAVGAEALGFYSAHELDRRKENFEEILKILMGVRAQVDTDPNDIQAADRWAVIEGPMITSLQKLSNHDERNAHEWQRWWNNNKKEDWPVGQG